MRNLLIPVLTALILAGCTEDPAATMEADAGAPPTAPAFTLGEPMQVAPKPNNQVEASISVSADGQTLLTCFHGLFTETSPGYASTDGGATWQEVQFPPEAGPGGDCETAITPDGAWAFLASTVAGATVLVSHDQGQTWTYNQGAAIPINGLADRPWIEAVGEELWLAYMPLNFQPGTIGFTKSTDYGQSWSTPTLIGTPTQDEVSVRHGHFALGNGTVYLPMVRYPSSFTAGERSVQLASTTDGGASWNVEEIYNSPQVIPDWPSLAVTEAGDLLFMVTMQRDPGARPAVLHRTPDNTSWSEPLVVHDPDGRSTFWPWIAGGHGRNATFIVDGGDHEGVDHVWIGRIDASTLDVETWPVQQDPAIEFASVDHDAQGNAYAVWTDAQAQYFVKGTLE